MTRAAALAALLAAAAACHRRPPLASCDDHLRGVYTTAPDGPAGPERWMILDSGDTLEAYPLFPDVDPTGGFAPRPAGGAVGVPTPRLAALDGPRELEIGPRRIDLTRSPAAAAGSAALAGTVHRRYMRRAEICEAKVPAHVTRCTGDTLELVLTDPAPPLGFSPCQWPTPAPSRRVRWQRE